MVAPCRQLTEHQTVPGDQRIARRRRGAGTAAITRSRLGRRRQVLEGVHRPDRRGRRFATRVRMFGGEHARRRSRATGAAERSPEVEMMTSSAGARWRSADPRSPAPAWSPGVTLASRCGSRPAPRASSQSRDVRRIRHVEAVLSFVIVESSGPSSVGVGVAVCCDPRFGGRDRLGCTGFEFEEFAERFGVVVASTSGRELFHPHRRRVKELVRNASHRLGDLVALRGVEGRAVVTAGAGSPLRRGPLPAAAARPPSASLRLDAGRRGSRTVRPRRCREQRRRRPARPWSPRRRGVPRC
jgi:hypothetical protein